MQGSHSDGLADIGGPTTNIVSWPPQPGILSIGLGESNAMEGELITTIATHISNILATCLFQCGNVKSIEEQGYSKATSAAALSKISFRT